jgi:5-aminolevulinate synthase
MIAGIRNGGGERKIFRHNDLAHLEALLGGRSGRCAQADRLRERLFDGRRHRRPPRHDRAGPKKYNAMTYLDEVHAVGLYGQTAAASPSATASGPDRHHRRHARQGHRRHGRLYRRRCG